MVAQTSGRSSLRASIILINVVVLGAMSSAVVIALLTGSLTSAELLANYQRQVEARLLASSCAELALEAIRDSRLSLGTSGSRVFPRGSCDYTISREATPEGWGTVTATGRQSLGMVRKITIRTRQIRPSISLVHWQEMTDWPVGSVPP